MRVPSELDRDALISATFANFPQCSCMRWHGGRSVCAGHEFLHDDPTGRGLCEQWERLLYVRSQRDRLLAQEGVRSPAPAPDPTRLPW